MFVFYRLFHRCIHSTPSRSSSSTSPESPFPSSHSDPEKERALVIWFAVFGLSLLFRPVAEFVIRILFFSACALLLSTLDGSLNLLVGHAVLRAAKYKGYESPLVSSVEAGSLGGIIVTGPTTLTTVFLIALLGGPKLQRVLSTHVGLLLELASVITVTTAACSFGVTIVRYVHADSQPLDATHAARAGVLGACMFTLPIMSTVAFLMHEAQTPPPARNEPVTLPPCLADNLECSVNGGASSARVRLRRHVVAHTAAETVGYVLVTLCILTIRLLCFR